MLKKLRELGSFEGKRIRVRQHMVEVEANKHQFCMEIADVSSAVAVLPVTEDGQIVLIENFRYPVQETVLEIPAGKLEGDNDDPLLRAKAELEEEAGYIASVWTDMGTIFSSPGITNERIHLFRATGLTKVDRRLEATEAGMSLAIFPPLDVLKMLEERRIKDAKTRLVLSEYLWDIAREKIELASKETH